MGSKAKKRTTSPRKKSKRIKLVSPIGQRKFGELVRQKLLEIFGRNLSHTARTLGVPRLMLSDIERGKLIPKADIYLLLCERLHLDPHTALADFREQPTPTGDANKAMPIRMIAEPVEASDEQRMTIDALVGSNKLLVGKHALFGLWGRFDRPGDLYSPFVLTSDGTLLYDSNLEDRRWKCDLRDGEIKVGRTFSYSDGSDYVVKYTIVVISEMPVLE